MQIRKLFQSTILRITLMYAAFFCTSVFVLLIFVYYATVREMENQIRHRISIQFSELQAVYKAHGLEDMKKQIATFMEEEEEGLAIYLLVDAQGKVLAGNMEGWPEDVAHADHWILFDLESRSVDEVHVLARDAVLADGDRLLVGYSLRGPDRTKKVMLDVVSASIILAFFITGLGGTLLSNLIKRRLERVNQICAQVISGNLNVTVPVTGSDDEFDHLGSNVNAMLSRIAELISGLKQTSDNIAHDLRTPLGRHRIRLEGLVAHPPAMTLMQEHIKAGIEDIDTLLETLNSILRISQAQSGVASGHFIMFDMSSVMVDVIEFYNEFAEEKGILIESAIPADIMVNGDKPLITQAIANLIDNAIKYTPCNGAITIALHLQERMVECVVADNGPGIPPEYYSKVKERFFRMEASRTSAGTGLGLSLVDAVAALHRGDLVLGDNTPGLKAALRLPIAV